MLYPSPDFASLIKPIIEELGTQLTLKKFHIDRVFTGSTTKYV